GGLGDDGGEGHHVVAHSAAFTGGGLARWGGLLGAGSKQPICHSGPARGAFARQMEATSRDLFATLPACGCGRTGCTRHNLAGNALRAGAVARWLFTDLAFGQLSRRSARGWSARCRGGGVLLPRRAAL